MVYSQAVEYFECTLNLENWLAVTKNQNVDRCHKNVTAPNNLQSKFRGVLVPDKR
jgi:hypothetical protein